MKVYSISRGSYSDYSVVCLFSERHKAEVFMKKYDLDPGYYIESAFIEEFVLDPESPEEYGGRSTNVYEIEFNPENDEMLDISIDNYHSGELNVVKAEPVQYSKGQGYRWIYRLYVETNNREDARKIASEIYMRGKALNILPDTSKPIFDELQVLDWIKDGKVKITFTKGEK